MGSLLDDYKVYAEEIISNNVNRNLKKSKSDWFLIPKPYKTYKNFNKLSYDKEYYENIDRSIIRYLLKNTKFIYEIKNYYKQITHPIMFYDEYQVILT